VKPATNYRYRVRAFNSTGASEYSNIAAGRISDPGPVPPGNMVAVAASAKRINLAWTDNSNDEVGFKIERSRDGFSFSLIATVDVNSISHSDPGLRPNRTYYYRVRSFNALGDSAYSNTASARTPPRLASLDSR
ncbi:MAG TPA: fibronectin type III domain-containing protein, partial [Blastocatellia bacterium]|nr:fibronectin type III domain-containing protein [Blastocatellia bacterium]